MEVLNGIKLQKHDLKKDGDQYVYFQQLISKKNTPDLIGLLTDKIFDEYEYLIITPENELMGVNNEQQKKLNDIPDAYELAQGMFNGG